MGYSGIVLTGSELGWVFGVCPGPRWCSIGLTEKVLKHRTLFPMNRSSYNCVLVDLSSGISLQVLKNGEGSGLTTSRENQGPRWVIWRSCKRKKRIQTKTMSRISIVVGSRLTSVVWNNTQLNNTQLRGWGCVLSQLQDRRSYRLTLELTFIPEMSLLVQFYSISPIRDYHYITLTTVNFSP